MEIKKIADKFRGLTQKYKYAITIFIIGLLLLWIPSKQSTPTKTNVIPAVASNNGTITEESLERVLQSVEGAGKVKVLLSRATGEETVFQTDVESTDSTDSNNQSETTVIITDSQRSEAGLIRQINPPAYKGAIVVCQGADRPTVCLGVTQAVSKITGLGTDAICVLKMQ